MAGNKKTKTSKRPEGGEPARRGRGLPPCRRSSKAIAGAGINRYFREFESHWARRREVEGDKYLPAEALLPPTSCRAWCADQAKLDL